MFGEYGRYETREITTGFMGFEFEITVLFVVLLIWLRVFYETKWGWSTGELLSTISTSSGIYYLDKFIS